MTFKINPRTIGGADRHARLLALILLAALVIRLVYVLSLEPRITWYDGREYSRLAVGLVEGRGYSTPWGTPTAFWPPGYPFFLAAIYSVTGVSVTAVRICEAVLGSLVCLLAYLIARQCAGRGADRGAGRSAALAAAAIAAAYPLHVYTVGSFFSVTLQTALVGAVAYCLLRAAARGSGACALIGGVLGGWAVLTAASVLPALLLGALWMAWVRARAGDDGASRLDPALTTGAPGITAAGNTAAARMRPRLWPAARLAILFLLPLLLIAGAWAARNQQAFGRPVLVSLNGGSNFWLGNYPGVTAATGNRWTPEMRAAWSALRDRYPDEAERDQAFYRQGIEFVQADPARFIWLSLSKAVYLWHLWPQPMTDQGHPEALVILGSVLSYGVLLLPALIGLGRALSRRREAWLVLLFCLSYSAVHALYISKVRFRLPLDTFVIVYAVVGLSWILGRFVPRWRGVLEEHAQ